MAAMFLLVFWILGPRKIFGAMMKQACRQTLKSLRCNKCLVGLKTFGAAEKLVLTPVCVED